MAHNNLGESQRHYVAWKKPVSKGYILYNPIYVTFWKAATVMENRSVADRLGVGKGVATKG